MPYLYLGGCPVGKDSKFGEDEIMERIYSDLRCGLSVDCVAYRAKVMPATLKNWLKRGKNGEELYVQFYFNCQKAIADAQAIYVGRINGASEEDWRAAAWMLERQWPEDFGDNKRELKEALKILKQIQSENIKTPIASQEAIPAPKPDDSAGKSGIKLEAISGSTDPSPELPG